MTSFPPSTHGFLTLIFITSTAVAGPWWQGDDTCPIGSDTSIVYYGETAWGVDNVIITTSCYSRRVLRERPRTVASTLDRGPPGAGRSTHLQESAATGGCLAQPGG
jgi:hypothetical protein